MMRLTLSILENLQLYPVGLFMGFVVVVWRVLFWCCLVDGFIFGLIIDTVINIEQDDDVLRKMFLSWDLPMFSSSVVHLDRSFKETSYHPHQVSWLANCAKMKLCLRRSMIESAIAMLRLCRIRLTKLYHIQSSRKSTKRHCIARTRSSRAAETWIGSISCSWFGIRVTPYLISKVSESLFWSWNRLPSRRFRSLFQITTKSKNDVWA